jgi:hypothetical protein
MALIPNFDRIVATITDSDIEKFLHSAAPDDDKQRVLNASSREIKMRLVGGYLIRTNQISTSRLNPKPVKVKVSTKATTDKPAKATKSTKAPKVSPAEQVSAV